MSLKEFVDQGGVIILREPKDLQNVVLGAKKVGYPVKKQYTCNGPYPFFFSVKDAKVLTSEDVKDRPLNMDVKDFLSMIDVITSTVKADEGDTVCVQCESQSDVDTCIDYFQTVTGQKIRNSRFLEEIPFFNLQNGNLYPAYCLKPGYTILSFGEFKEKFISTQPGVESEGMALTEKFISKIDAVMKSLRDLESFLRSERYV
ncbi:hypothetical protein [Barnesiella intestinihominis]|uniref:hypothetical protein n=1 Tax=Barnesiella intestinihominis TaxID=487174 RepID=UPI003AB88255